ncbi:uncharacterized protein V6R79_012548 [Siganus canaliculatus]
MDGTPEVAGTTCMIIPLALPKGTDKLCELCQRRARLQCAQCRVTYYCESEHQQDDWVGIHQRICQLLVPIRTPVSFSPQQAAHTELQLKKLELIEICQSVVKHKLSEGKHKEALPAAQLHLHCCLDVHGASTVQMVPAYLLLAEANMGLGNLNVVTSFLSEAEWVVLKSPECGHAVHHQLHRSLGRLHTATGNLEAALLDFANDVYYASEEYGEDSTVTSGGYFLMANVFAKQGKTQIARSLYAEVAHTWYCHLTKLLNPCIQNVQDHQTLLEPSYDQAQLGQADEMFRTMLEFHQSDSRKDSAQTALVAYCLAMLCFLLGDSQTVRMSTI